MAIYSNYTDEQLLSLLRAGDHVSYTEIFNRYWAGLYLHAKKMLHDEDEAMDVVQDIFTVLWSKSSDLELTTGLRPYLYTSVRNQVLKIIGRGKLKEKFIDKMTLSLTELIPYTDEQISYNELEKLIAQEISNLPPRMHQIYIKCHIEGRSHKEIAAELNISEHTVKTTVHRAVTILRSKIADILAVLLLINKL